MGDIRAICGFKDYRDILLYYFIGTSNLFRSPLAEFYVTNLGGYVGGNRPGRLGWLYMLIFCTDTLLGSKLDTDIWFLPLFSWPALGLVAVAPVFDFFLVGIPLNLLSTTGSYECLFFSVNEALLSKANPLMLSDSPPSRHMPSNSFIRF